MTATLPGDIDDLLRLGSVVRADLPASGVDDGTRGVVWAVGPGDDTTPPWCHVVWIEGPSAGTDSGTIAQRCVCLDATDPTSRAHAVWRLDGAPWDDVEAAVARYTGHADAARQCAWWVGGCNCTPASIEALCRVVLHVTGRAS